MLARLHGFLFLLAVSTAHPAPESALDRLRVASLDTSVVGSDSAFSAAPPADGEGETPSLAAFVADAFHPRFAATVARAARGVRPARDTNARYVLSLDSLAFSTRSRAVARRFVPPSPPGFDPATGEATPGERRGRVEGPGLMNTLTATARWTLWDRAGDSAAARGIATGSSSFRAEARRGDWEAAARELALAVLRETPFAPRR